MKHYKFVSDWQVNAPLEKVWGTIKQSETWPEWWKGVIRVVELKEGDADGLGSIRRSTWKSALPYTLEFDSEVIRIEPMSIIEARAFGELDGIGLWQFDAMGDESTRIRYDWQVKTTKRWMNFLAPIAKPFFNWNHDVIMRWGEDGLKKRLEEPVRR